MKRLCNIAAVLSLLLFTWLVGSAVFDLFFVLPRVSIPLAIPAAIPMVHEDGKQLDCMAQNIYWEAQGEKALGKIFVGMVVMERLHSPHFPSTVCGVVFQGNRDAHGKSIRHMCSFSWTCDGADHDINFNNIIDRREWLLSYSIAKQVLAGKAHVPIDMVGVTHYHADYAKPFWSKDHKDYKLVATIGHHLFYRWKKAMISSNATVAMR
jgi:spore germination cell wall hydrolase CwlJ-like protein